MKRALPSRIDQHAVQMEMTGDVCEAVANNYSQQSGRYYSLWD